MNDIIKCNIAKMLLLFLGAVSLLSWMDPYRDEVSKGNELYHGKKFSDAQKHYKNADQYAPTEKDKKKLSFNRANADYMTENYEGAIAGYRRSLQSEDKDVQKKAFLNLGNTYLKLGKNREAAEAYINALKIDPQYEKAKKNIEYMLKRKQKKKDDKNSKDNNKGNKNQSDKSKKSGNKEKGKKDKAAQGKMNREQIRSLLESMKKKPVRRQKGKQNEKRYLEKYW